MEPDSMNPEKKQGTEPGPEPDQQETKAASEGYPAAEAVELQVRESEIVRPTMDGRKFASVSRRELLKVAPVLVLGAFAIPAFQEGLLKRGLAFSDWASKWIFRRGHLAPTFADSALTQFEKFPINDYDVDDPGVILENWTLKVSGEGRS